MPADNSKSGRAPKPRDPATAAVLERLESRLTAVLSESVSPALPYAPYLTPADFADSFDRFAYPSGYPTDRKAGKNYPVIRNETDLRTARAFSRFLADTNPLVIGFLDHITNFVVGTGYKWTVGLRGAAGNSPQEKADPAVRACQAVLDEFRALNGWGDQHEITFGDLADDGDDSPSTDLEAECWRSAMRDGETFLRLFRGGASTNGIPRVRRVNPECVYCPPDQFSEGPWSFGIETDPDDRQKRLAFHVADPDLYPTGGEIVPARAVVHFKLNVDSDIKRGVPDFWPLESEVQHLRKSWQNMAEVTAILSAIAYIRQHAAGVSGTQIRNMADAIKSGTDSRSAKFYDQFQGGDIYRTYTRHEGGTVVDITNGMEFVSPPAVAGMPGFVQGMQAVLRIVGLRWGCPEYFSGDSSNANYASTLVAGGPFERAAQMRQKSYRQFQGNLIHRVLLLAAEAGRLSPDVIRKVAVKVTAPAVAIANKAEDTSRRVQLMQAAGLSKRTVLEEEGYDPDQEAANVAKEQPPAPPGGPGGAPPQDGTPVPQGGPSPDAGPTEQPPTEQQPVDLAASLFGEAKVSEATEPADPLPPELLAALLLAHQEGNQDAVDQLLELANDPALLAAVMDGPPADGEVAEAVDRSHLVFDKVKRRWVNPNKQPRERKTPAGQLTPKEQLIARKQAAEPARQAAREAWAGAVADPAKITPDQLKGLADHLHALTRDELREVARGLQKKVGGLKREVVDRLLGHVGAQTTVRPKPGNLFGEPDETPVGKLQTLAIRAGIEPDGGVFKRGTPEQQREQLFDALATAAGDRMENGVYSPGIDPPPAHWPESLRGWYSAEQDRRADDEMAADDAAEKKAAKFTGVAANGVRYVDGVPQTGPEAEEPKADAPPQAAADGTTDKPATPQVDDTDAGGNKAGMDTNPPAPPTAPEPEADESLVRQPGEPPLDYLRRAVPRVANLPSWRDVQTALAELKRDQIPEAETLLGATKPTGYQMSPHSHLSSRFADLYAQATARRGHADRLARAKALLAGADTAADPTAHQREWDDLFDIMNGMTDERERLLAADLGIEPDMIQGKLSASGPLRRAMRSRLQSAIDRRRLAAVVADPKKYGFGKRDVANSDGLVFVSRELYSRSGRSPDETFSPGDVLGVNGVPHVVTAAAKPKFTRGYSDDGEQVGPNKHRQNLLLRPAGEADVIGQQIRDLEKQHGTYSLSSDSVLDHSEKIAHLRQQLDALAPLKKPKK